MPKTSWGEAYFPWCRLTYLTPAYTMLVSRLLRCFGLRRLCFDIGSLSREIDEGFRGAEIEGDAGVSSEPH